MGVTNTESGTNIHEVADGIYRINTPLSVIPGGFSFNQYLIVDDEPLLFHTGLRKEGLDYFSHARNTRDMLERLAASEPTTLACMHGSAWRGDGSSLLRALANELDKER
jgi:hypothetical protein